MVKKLHLDPLACICSLLCSAAFLLWMRHATGGIHGGSILFLLLLPLAFFYLGDGSLRLLRVSLRSAQGFPFAFLFGSILGMLLLFLLHLCFPIPLRAANALLLLLALSTAALAPARESREEKKGRGWAAIAAVLLVLAAASLWTQDLRPALTRQGNSIVIGPWQDALFHAEFTAELHQDVSLPKLGDPNLAGLHLPLYHYASYILPASVEVWSPGTTAFEALMTFWIPFGFVLLGLVAFCLASEWTGDLAGIAALAAVLMIPSTPVYGVPIALYSFHLLIAISVSLAYGIACAAAGLILLTRGLQEDRKALLLAGFVTLAATVLIKAHIALVAVPLGVFWVICCKRGWSRRLRLAMATATALAGFIVLWVLDRCGIGPQLLPSGPPVALADIDSKIAALPPGLWRHLTLGNIFFLYHLFHPFGIVLVLLIAVLGIWLLLWPSLLLWKRRRGEWRPFDAVPLLAGGIFLLHTFVPGPNRHGTIDEVWHRPFVWLYFVATVWCAASLTEWLQRRGQRREAVLCASVVGLSALLLLVPWLEGKSIQHGMPSQSWGNDIHVDVGLMDCALFLREHAEPMDVVQNDVSSQSPLLPAFAERRAYLGILPLYWEQYLNGTDAMREAERRAAILEAVKEAKDDGELQKFRDGTGIRWYIAGPDEALSWPADVLQHPVFASGGFRVYDLKQMGSLH